jgi:glycosyltransferase involved in cell wall biosynthesis
MVKQILDIGFFSEMYSQTNGTAHAVKNLSEAIAKTGHNVHVFAPKIVNGHDIPKTLHYHDLGGAYIGKETGLVASVPLQKMFFCPHDYLDITHMHTHATIGPIAINWAKYLGIPMIGTHNAPLTYYTAQNVRIIGNLLTKSDLLWRYERHLLNKYDLIHVPTRSKKTQLRSWRFMEPIICLSNGIPDAMYTDLKENGIREKYNIEDKKVLLYASRLSTEKHPISILKTFKEIQKEVPDAYLLMVGSGGASSDHVKRVLKRKAFRDIASYAGRVPFVDLLRLYKTADLSALWSWVEAEGLVLIEAMAQGTPTVGANACGISNVIRHGETGYLANDLNQFKDSVVKLLKDDALRAEFGKNAKRVAQEYKISKIAESWIKLYKFTIDELYPLRYYRKERRERVELVKEFVKHLTNVTF